VLLWVPLLQHLHSLHHGFLIVLCDLILSALLGGNLEPGTSEHQPDSSYDMCLARWVMWSIETWDSSRPQTDFDLRKQVTTNLLQALSQAVVESARDRTAVTALLQSLCAGNPQLETVLAKLLKLSENTTTDIWSPDDIDMMDQRLNSLLSASITFNHLTASSSPSSPAKLVGDLIPGWRILDESSGWRPCPIGVHFTAMTTAV